MDISPGRRDGRGSRARPPGEEACLQGDRPQAPGSSSPSHLAEEQRAGVAGALGKGCGDGCRSGVGVGTHECLLGRRQVQSGAEGKAVRERSYCKNPGRWVL